ncbi:hypothetical protein BKA70DRAFT_1295744 [Coprinopsis sp. MPI-PUGE-AT-0042]|nr:hypothetical protein BKA70DRAFT_1295744 [Coprinopsis sp. MPI-PUGE-AT-0042]
MAFTRTLNFVSKDLGKKAAVMFVFDDLETTGNLFKDCYPICFKLVGFSAQGPSRATIHYSSQLTFIKPQVNSLEGVSPSTFVPMKFGQQTSLLMSSPDPPLTYGFTEPVVGGEGVMVATNKTDRKCDIGVGFPVDEYTPQVCHLFKDVGVEEQVVASFTPVLRGYIATHQWRQNQILSAPLQSPCIFHYNLADLDESTTWLVNRDPQGRWSIDLLPSLSPLDAMCHLHLRCGEGNDLEGRSSSSGVGRPTPSPTKRTAIHCAPRPVLDSPDSELASFSDQNPSEPHPPLPSLDPSPKNDSDAVGSEAETA